MDMADNSHNDNYFFSSIPSWDGDPTKFPRFKKAVEWWLEGTDLAKTAGYNLASRFVTRQTGAAKTRAMEFNPIELRFLPAVSVADPDDATGIGMIVFEPANYSAGIEKVMTAFGAMIGEEPVGKKSNLRDYFHDKLHRRPGE